MPKTLSLSLLGEKSNIADGEKRTRTTECCRSTDEEQNPAGPTSRSRTITQAPAQPGPSTQNMSFKEAYRYYAYGDLNSYQAGSSGYAGDQGPYYSLGMHSSYGP